MPKSPSKKDAGQPNSGRNSGKDPKVSGKAKAAPASAETSKLASRPTSKPPAPPKLSKPAKPHRPVPAFPKKNQPPTPAAFAARLPLSLGKRFDQVRGVFAEAAGRERGRVLLWTGDRLGAALPGRRRARCARCTSTTSSRSASSRWNRRPPPGSTGGRCRRPGRRRASRPTAAPPCCGWTCELEGGGATDFRSIVRAKLAARTADPGRGLGWRPARRPLTTCFHANVGPLSSGTGKNTSPELVPRCTR